MTHVGGRPKRRWTENDSDLLLHLTRTHGTSVAARKRIATEMGFNHNTIYKHQQSLPPSPAREERVAVLKEAESQGPKKRAHAIKREPTGPSKEPLKIFLPYIPSLDMVEVDGKKKYEEVFYTSRDA